MGIAFILIHHRGDGSVPLTRSFSDFPLSIGGWEGTSLTLSDKEKQILRADDYALVNYTPSAGGSPVLFYTAYYSHQTAQSNIHSPKNCLPGSGWAVLSSSTIRVPFGSSDKNRVSISESVIQKGLSKQVVLYWYQERGRIFDNEYWGRFYLVKDALMLHRTDGALIRISMPLTGTIENTVNTELSLARTISPLLARYIPGRTLTAARGSSQLKNPSGKSVHGTY